MQLRPQRACTPRRRHRAAGQGLRSGAHGDEGLADARNPGKQLRSMTAFEDYWTASCPIFLSALLLLTSRHLVVALLSKMTPLSAPSSQRHGGIE
jgi:hypothetical protein